MQCVTVTVKIRSQLAIGYAPTYADGARFTVQNHLVQVGQRDLVLRAVGDPVKGVASTQCPQFAAALYDLPHLLDRLGLIQVIGAVGVISRPIAGRGGLGCSPGASGDNMVPARKAPDVLRNSLLSIPGEGYSSGRNNRIPLLS